MFAEKFTVQGSECSRNHLDTFQLDREVMSHCHCGIFTMLTVNFNNLFLYIIFTLVSFADQSHIAIVLNCVSIGSG